MAGIFQKAVALNWTECPRYDEKAEGDRPCFPTMIIFWKGHKVWMPALPLLHQVLWQFQTVFRSQRQRDTILMQFRQKGFASRDIAPCLYVCGGQCLRNGWCCGHSRQTTCAEGSECLNLSIWGMFSTRQQNREYRLYRLISVFVSARIGYARVY